MEIFNDKKIENELIDVLKKLFNEEKKAISIIKGNNKEEEDEWI